MTENKSCGIKVVSVKTVVGQLRKKILRIVKHEKLKYKT